MPRKSSEEVIADLEAKLAEAKAKASTRVEEQIAKIRERIDALVLRKEKIDDQIKTLQIEVDELTRPNTEAPADVELPIDEPAAEAPAKKAKANAGAQS